MNRFERQRRHANLLLIGLAIAFVGCIPFRDHGGAWPWIFIMLEASLAAACADWFAITALFRRPFGLPIPHTAIVPRKHDDIGTGLVKLIRERLLPVETLREAIRQSQPAEFILAQARRSGPGEIAAAAIHWLQRLDDTGSLAAQLHAVITGALRRTAIATRLGGILDRELQETSLEPMIDPLLDSLDDLLGSEACALALENRLRAWKREQSERLDWWKRPLVELADATGALNEAEAAQDGVEAIRKELAQARACPEHELRVALRSWAGKLADDLQGETLLAGAIDEWWAEVVETMDFREPAEDLLRHLLSAENLSALQPALADAIERSLAAVSGDAELAARLDERTRKVLSESLPLVYELLEPFVKYVFAQRLTEADLVRFIEEEVGDVLQQLRITGTIVGGIVGLGLALLLSLPG